MLENVRPVDGIVVGAFTLDWATVRLRQKEKTMGKLSLCAAMLAGTAVAGTAALLAGAAAAGGAAALCCCMLMRRKPDSSAGPSLSAQ
jgi:hypothetical protein